MFDLTPRARVVFAAAYLAAQGALVITARSRPGGTFGHRMFSESSTVSCVLRRELAGGALVAAPGGDWNARDAGGTLRRFSWRERVRRPELSTFGVELPAPDGVEARVAGLQAALDDVFKNTRGDAETRRLVLDVRTRRNGHAPESLRLHSRSR